MSSHFAAIAYTPGVRAAQRRFGGAEAPKPPGDLQAHLSARERAFIAARDSFFLATVGEGGWPHVQHRGGAPGFLRVLDDSTLAFADLGGNRQFVSTGNLAGNPRAALILLDYPQRRRLKLMAEIEVLAADEAPPALLAAVEMPKTPPTERVMLLHVAAFDWNCSRFITPRYTEAELAALGVALPASL
ncbi:pyridoxamine 5'-phosphate oxidase family protein [Azohydromonas lata]|uniref:pyridoxamine 5'-phosphate oxidase family protein n=1 Tax=Azohydromonas lata TaxID=45677 RepID=UPI00082F38F0|nr:pyridoxamine 5'-phosphate oxidase family protein [Azohydromonas lata]